MAAKAVKEIAAKANAAKGVTIEEVTKKATAEGIEAKSVSARIRTVEDLLRHPYLGPHFELTERAPGAAPELRYLFNYTFGCLLSLGFGGASISGMKYSIPRLISGITGWLFEEDRDAHYQSLRAFDEREF